MMFEVIPVVCWPILTTSDFKHERPKLQIKLIKTNQFIKIDLYLQSAKCSKVPLKQHLPNNSQM